jgi:D-serine dehydratase
MCPQIYHRQLQAGAWGITVATASQAMVCVRAGVRRILIANQLVGRASITSLARSMSDIPDLEVYCLVDSVDAVHHLATHLEAAGATRPVNALVEWGRLHWRTGARSLDAALLVCDEVQRCGRFINYAGLEGFEGLAHSEAGDAEDVRQVNEFLEGVLQLAAKLGGIGGLNAPLFSVGGSAFLDRVQDAGRVISGRFQVVLRSGCYVTHDHILYKDRLRAARLRAGGAAMPEFFPALELWSLVQSLPDPGVAILTFGKRDCAYDLDLPIPLFAVPASSALADKLPLDGMRITQLNDQHAYLNGGVAQLSVGDRICCGISHPCTAFDKWRVIPVVDDSYNVQDWYRTYF